MTTRQTNNLLLIVLLTLSSFSFGQNDKLKARQKIIEKIKSEVAKINKDSNYVIKTIDTDQFIRQNKEGPDGGQELAGYYKDKMIKKIVRTFGISYGRQTEQYFCKDDQLIFVFIKHEVYPSTKDNSELDFTKLETKFEGRYYFDEGKLIETLKNGKAMFSDETDAKEKSLLADSKKYIKELKGD